MSIKEQLTLAAALAVSLSLAALFPVFQGGDWFYRVLGAVLAVMITGLVTRRLGVPRALQPLLSLLVVAGYLCVVFASDTLTYGLPDSTTWDALRSLVDHGRADVQKYGPPVPPSQGLVLLTAAGVGGVAVLVDTIAVVLDRAAIAGLPLLALFAVPSAVLPGGLGGLPFVLGAVGWLSLLLVEGSERLGRWGTPMRSSLPGARPGGDDSSLGRVGRRIGFAAVGMAIVIPAVIPGLDHRLINGNGSGDGSGDGGGPSQATTYNPITRLKDQLALPKPRTLLVYRTDDPNPDYLRMTTLDEYDNGEWSASNLVADRESAKVQKGIPTPVGDGGAHRDVTMRIAVDHDHLDVHWLPVPFGPTKVSVTGTWLWDSGSQTVFSAARTTKNLPPYTVQASRVLPDRDALAQAEVGGIDPTIRADYDKPLDVTTYVKDLATQITKGKHTEYDKAAAIQAFFTKPSSGFVYDLKASQPVRGGDALEAFLTGKHGFCEQYATAMAVLLRVAGIPSRVAVGFTPGTRDSKDKTAYSITTSDAHAWPEAWFAATGWVRFEPTPAASGSTIPAYSIPATVAPNNPTTPGVTPTTKPSAKPSKNGRVDTDLLKDKGGAAASGARSGGSTGVSLWLLVPIALVLALVLPVTLTWLRRRRRWRTPGALTAWSQLQDDATDVGYRWHPSESPRAAAASLAKSRRLRGPAGEALARLAMAAEQSRYAPPGRSDGRDLRGDVAAVRAALQEGSPFRMRAQAVLFPASTLQWAYHGVGEALGRALDKLDDGIAAATRPIRSRTAPH